MNAATLKIEQMEKKKKRGGSGGGGGRNKRPGF